MPMLGWLASIKMADFISGVDHWLAFALLILVGYKMIYESAKPENCAEKRNLGFFTLLILSIATSIDALTVGLSFALLKVSIINPHNSDRHSNFYTVVYRRCLRRKIRKLSPNKVEIAGGIILIVIGFKILIEHLA